MGPGFKGLGNAFIAINETGLYVGVQGQTSATKHWSYTELDNVKKVQLICFFGSYMPKKKGGFSTHSIIRIAVLWGWLSAGIVVLWCPQPCVSGALSRRSSPSWHGIVC